MYRDRLASRLECLCLAGALSAVMAGCGGSEAGTPDAATLDAARPDTAGACACDDHAFCNGVETCGAMGACTAGVAPCAAQTCDEAADRCTTTCVDADGDGATAMSCGGTDCDDTDPHRAPGSTEVCDATHDEDCNPSTFGSRDADGDGHVDATCCNVVDGTSHCGDDCDDSRNVVYPGDTEACDGFDNDCDGTIDEGVLAVCYADADHDGYRDVTSSMTACSCPAGTLPATAAIDCNDANMHVHPAAACGTTALGPATNYDYDCDGVTSVPTDVLDHFCFVMGPNCNVDSGRPHTFTTAQCGMTISIPSGCMNSHQPCNPRDDPLVVCCH